MSITPNPHSESLEGSLVLHTAPNSMARAIALCNLAQTERLSKHYLKAEQLYRLALEKAYQAVDKDDSQTAQIEKLLGGIYREEIEPGLGIWNSNKSEALLLSALKYVEDHAETEARNISEILKDLSWLYWGWSRPEQHNLYYERERAPYKDYAQDASHIAELFLKCGDVESAIPYLQKTVEFYEPEGNAYGRLHMALYELGKAYEALGRYDKLQEVKERLLQTHQEASIIRQGPFPSATANTLSEIAATAFKNGDYTTAKTALEAVIAEMELSNDTTIRKDGCCPRGPQYANCQRLLGHCLLDGERNHQLALKSFDKYIAAITQGSASAKPSYSAMQTDFLTDMLICCDGTENLARADEYRIQIKDRLDKNQSTHNEAIALLDQTKRTQVEEIELMESIAKAASRSHSAISLVQRAITMRTKHEQANCDAIKNDYSFLASLTDTLPTNKGGVTEQRQIEWLEKNGGQAPELATANIQRADYLRTERRYFMARKRYIKALSFMSNLEVDKKIEVLINIAGCCHLMEHYAEGIEPLENVRQLAKKDSQVWRRATVQLGTFYDFIGKHDEATILYKDAINGVDNVIDVIEPLSKACEKTTRKVQYQIAEILHQRKAMLLNASKQNMAQVPDVWINLARMYRRQNMCVRAQIAYQRAIDFCHMQESRISNLKPTTMLEQQGDNETEQPESDSSDWQTKHDAVKLEIEEMFQKLPLKESSHWSNTW